MKTRMQSHSPCFVAASLHCPVLPKGFPHPIFQDLMLCASNTAYSLVVQNHLLPDSKALWKQKLTHLKPHKFRTHQHSYSQWEKGFVPSTIQGINFSWHNNVPNRVPPKWPHFGFFPLFIASSREQGFKLSNVTIVRLLFKVIWMHLNLCLKSQRHLHRDQSRQRNSIAPPCNFYN